MRLQCFAIKVTTAVLLLVMLCSSALAQSYRGRVQGVVTDQTKAIIVGADVSLLNIATGVKTTRKTSETGLYLFDLVEPGTYTVSVELAGFGKFVQENIIVQMRGDVSVDVSLKPGAVQESVTVSETPVSVQFNSANKDFTIDSKLTQDIPRIDRNPFKLTLLAPSAVNTRGEMLPYHSWAANSVDLGGGTNLKNDLQVDGSPIGLGQKNSYPPNTDAVQEVVVSQNSVDAESGHSAGGLISMTLKSGTNEWHGSAFYLGRYPWLNAEADRTRHSTNAQRQHMMGGTLGNAIIKNKLFNFFSLEYWKVGSPNSYSTQVPTALERDGDFSRSFNIDGGIKTIFDPYTTTLNQATGVATRTPFAENRIPKSRFDPLSSSLMGKFWDPNNPGDNITGVNNYKAGFIQTSNYYNYSDRVDYNINDNWRVYGRVGRYHTTDIGPNATPNNSELYSPTGTLRAAWQVSGDGVWTVNSRTVVNFHGDWHKVIDAYVSDSLGPEGWGVLWPSNPWYKDYQEASPGVPVYYPQMNIGGNGFGGRGFYWDQKPQGQAYSAKIAQQHGSHFLKAGVEHRRGYGVTFVGNTSNFYFPTELTADTYISPNTRSYGNGYATFLLGSLDGNSQMIGGPSPDPHVQYWGMYIQDDWKVNRRLTINVGLRNEYESAWWDPLHNMSKGLDIYAPIPEMAATPPNMPDAALKLVGPNYYQYNGQWQWTTNESPGSWDAPRVALAPRAGAAIKLDEQSVLRIGYARYVIPTEMNLSQAPVSGFETVSFLEPPFFGVKGYQNTQGLRQGVPQQTISNPYPASNPLLTINGKAYGTNLGRGGAPLLWYPKHFQKAYNDRINFNYQRQLPGQVMISGTYFLNLGNQHYTKSLNNIDPRIQVEQQGAITGDVANPFYNYLTPTLFPGPSRNQEKVSLQSLLVRYPQYGGLYEVGTLGAAERYHSFEVKAQKAYSKGYNFLVAYVYIHEKTEQFFNALDDFTNNLSYLNSNQPRHRVTMAGTYELPFGKGRPFMTNANKLVDGIFGGWKLSGISTYSTGSILRFGTMNYNGADPTVSNPTPEKWFNTDAFSPIKANTVVIRSNPIQFDQLTGPQYFMIDGTLTKDINITERVKMELKMAAYNAINRLNRGNPNMDVNNSQFGQALYQGTPSAQFGPQTQELGNVSGRQVELGLKIRF